MTCRGFPPAPALIREAMDAGKPVLGYCPGGQLISKALGGIVGHHPTREPVGFMIQRGHRAPADAWRGGLPDELNVFHWHGEIFSIPPGGARVLGSAVGADQAS